MSQRLDSVTEGMTDALTRIKHAIAKGMDKTRRFESQVSTAQGNFDAKTERLAFIDTDEEHEIRSDSVDHSWSLFGVAPVTLQIQTDRPIITHARFVR
jgi:hypothetical protein